MFPEGFVESELGWIPFGWQVGKLQDLLGLERFNAGSAVPSLNRNHVHGKPTVIPASAIVARSETIARQLFLKKSQCRSESDSLVSIRDTLLPRLFSGEIRVPESIA